MPPEWLLPATIPAVAFLALHALVHVADALAGAPAAAHAGIIDAIGVYGPPAAALLIVAFARRAAT